MYYVKNPLSPRYKGTAVIRGGSYYVLLMSGGRFRTAITKYRGFRYVLRKKPKNSI